MIGAVVQVMRIATGEAHDKTRDMMAAERGRLCGLRGDKKLANHAHMVALYTVWYNWCRIHKTLRVTPAIAAGLTDKFMKLEDVVRLIDELEVQQKAA